MHQAKIKPGSMSRHDLVHASYIIPPYSFLIIMFLLSSTHWIYMSDKSQESTSQGVKWCLPGRKCKFDLLPLQSWYPFTSCLRRIPTAASPGWQWQWRHRLGRGSFKAQDTGQRCGFDPWCDVHDGLDNPADCGHRLFSFFFLLIHSSNALSVFFHSVFCLRSSLFFSYLWTSLALSSLLSWKLTFSFHILCDLEVVLLGKLSRITCSINCTYINS